MLCTCKKDKPKRRSRQGSECSRSPSSPPDERDCFHKFQQHVDKIKKFAPQRQWGTITGVPLEGSTRIPEFDHSDHSTAKQLTAAIQIGAEAERRQEMKIEKLQEELDGVIELNDSLLEELRQRDGDISLLKGDICKNRQENECLQRSINILQDQSKSIEKDIESLEEENIKLKDVNEKLRREADKVRKELDDLQMCHKLCLSEQETKAFNEELRILKFQLNQALDKNAIHQEKIDTFKEKNSMMNVEVFNLNKQLEQERQKQCDISSSYKQKINELKHQIDVLEFELERLKEELEIKFQIESKLNREIEHLKQKSDLKKYEEEANLTIIDQLSEIIKTQEKEIKKLLNNNNDIQLTKKIGEVSSEVSCKGEERYNTRSLLDQNTTQLKESEALLNEVCALQDNVLNFGNNIDECGLIESIKDIRDRLMDRIEAEERKRDGIKAKIDQFKLQFAQTQEEIFYLRSKRNETQKEEIQQRVRKEAELSYAICTAEQERRKICSQYDILMKALVTLKKVCGSSSSLADSQEVQYF